MYAFLDCVAEGELKRIVRYACPTWLKDQVSELDRGSLYRVLFSLYGYDLLYESHARLVLLETLPEHELEELAASLGKPIRTTAYDTALDVANEAWRVGGALPWRFAELFKIPHSYLPARSRQAAATELLQPTPQLPELFDYQEEIISDLQGFFRDEKSRACLIQLPTGAGKTRTLVEALVQELNVSESLDRNAVILWLSHT